MKRIAFFLLSTVFTLLTVIAAEIPNRPEKLTFPPLTYEPPNAADFRVPLKSGPVAYIAPDRELPLVNITIMIRAGDYLEPEGREGVASFTGYLLSRSGIPSKNADALEERMAFLAARLGSTIGETQGTVSLNLLQKDLDEGFATLRDVLTAPQFEADKLALHKQQTLQGMKQRNDDAADIEARERGFLSTGDNFFANRYTTQASINSITREDLIAFHKRWCHPPNFVVAVSGDFEKAEMTARLEKLFANWPFQGEKSPPIPSNPVMASAGLYMVDKDVNQGRVSVLLPGLMREDPDYPAAAVMNDILGGGGFTSRIMNRVRSDEGLAYSAGSGLPGGVWYPSVFRASFQSKSRTVAYATSIVIEEMKHIAEAPVSDEELETAKKSFIETFPRTFASKAQTVAIFAGDEFTGRYQKNPDHWKTWRGKINAVKKEDVQRVAKRLVKPERAVILVVGQKDEIQKGHPNHPVTLQSLSVAPLKDLPLRDPMTMKPLPATTK